MQIGPSRYGVRSVKTKQRDDKRVLKLITGSNYTGSDTLTRGHHPVTRHTRFHQRVLNAARIVNDSCKYNRITARLLHLLDVLSECVSSSVQPSIGVCLQSRAPLYMMESVVKV